MQTYTCKHTLSSLIPTLFTLLTAACLLTGCTTTPATTARKEPGIELLSDGSILLYGKSIAAEDLPRKLKSRGYKLNDAIVITIPSDTRMDAPPAALKQLSSALAAAGFRRVAFAKERHSAAYTNPPKK
jgi:hypothetical protein